MAGGEVCVETFKRVTEASKAPVINLDVPSFSGKECCLQLPALAVLPSDPDAADEFKNDYHVVTFNYDTFMTSSVVLKLQKDGIDLATLTDDTYGTNYAYGFQTSVDGTRSFVGYRLDWQTILFLEGEAKYQIVATHTDILTNVTTETSFEFCLKTYSLYNANETTRFTWYLNGFIGDFFDDELVLDYRNLASFLGGDGWINQIRLPKSFFGNNKSEYEREYIRYTNGQKVFIQDEQIEQYKWTTGRYDYPLHNFIKTNILQADRILVTDFNRLNDNNIVNKAVKPLSNYEPEYKVNTLLSRAVVEFEQEFQNRRKLRC